MTGEAGKIEFVIHYQGGHAGPSLRAGHAHAIDVRLLDAGENGQRLRNLGGGDVLPLPAEGVADAIDEIEVAEGVLPHEVAGPEPPVALFKDVVQDLFLRRSGVGIAFE